MDFLKKIIFFLEIYKINLGRNILIGSIENRKQTIFFLGPKSLVGRTLYRDPQNQLTENCIDLQNLHCKIKIFLMAADP